MDISTLQCSSGSESGWTQYLDPSSENQVSCVQEEEEEDSSLVSDASYGGPTHVEDCLYEQHRYRYRCSFISSLTSEFASKTKKGKKANEHGRHQHRSDLEDTASSTALSFPKKNTTLSWHEDYSNENLLNLSQGISTTHFEKNQRQLSLPKNKNQLAQKNQVAHQSPRFFGYQSSMKMQESFKEYDAD